jgi:digeranylgeranylglycerophospholipid reductase
LRTDVLVVGGGIAGSTLASILSSRGFDVTIVERRPRVGYPHHCSGILGFDAIRELVTFSEDWVLSEINHATFISPGGFKIEIDKPLAKVVDRSIMDLETWEHALSSGAKGMLSTPFKGLASKSEAIVRGGTISFDLIVGADGSLSSVARAFGLRSLETELGLQRKCEGRIGDEYVVRVLRESRFSWMQPWGDCMKLGAIGEFGEIIEVMRSCEAPIGKIEGNLIPRRPRKKFYGENFALIGDAAGQVKPLSRGGVLLAVRAAKILAEEFERGGLRRLSSYERRWWEINGREVALGMAARRYLEGLSPRDLDNIFLFLRDFEDIIQESFETDRQTSPLSRIPKAKVLKLTLMRPGAMLRAMMELVKQMVVTW